MGESPVPAPESTAVFRGRTLPPLPIPAARPREPRTAGVRVTATANATATNTVTDGVGNGVGFSPYLLRPLASAPLLPCGDRGRRHALTGWRRPRR